MGMLDGLLDGFKNMFSGGTSTPAEGATAPAANNGGFLDNPMLQTIGMGLLGASGSDMLQPLLMMKLLGGDNSSGNSQSSTTGSSGEPRIPDVSKINTNLPAPPSSIPSNKQELLKQLQISAAAAYPNNPMMQQVAMTQAIHESNLMGKPSQLARQHNNYFGIKAPGTGGTVSMRTGEVFNGVPTTVMAGFGRNNSMNDSFMQYQKLMNNKRYAPVMGAPDVNSAFAALQRSGYATDPRYANKLGAVYSQYVAPLYH